MDLFTGLTLMGTLAFIGTTIYVANHEQAQGSPPKLSRYLLYVIIVTMGLLALSAYFLTTSPDYSGTTTELGIAIGLVVAGVGLSTLALNSDLFRQLLQRIIGAAGSFQANSGVHIVAFVLMIALFLWNTVPFVMQGGVEGYAEALEQSGISVGEPIINAVLQISVAFLGIGLYIRRSPSESFERLGLRKPTQQDFVAGVGVGVAMLLLALAYSAVWITISPQNAEEQSSAANQIAQQFASLPLAFLLASCAALGEEIFMRGALQPVFGLVGSTIFFSVLHAQYLITPGLLFIFIVSLILGLLRKQVSTNAAIVAHFVFDFFPLALLALGTVS